MSISKFADRAPGKSLRRIYRENFQKVFAAYLNKHFHSPEQVAKVFEVNRSTAERWMSGNHRPTGDAVAYAIAMHGEIASQSFDIGDAA